MILVKLKDHNIISKRWLKASSMTSKSIFKMITSWWNVSLKHKNLSEKKFMSFLSTQKNKLFKSLRYLTNVINIFLNNFILVKFQQII